ncbi:MAG: AAA family ATPase [Bacteroidota bacterium]
MKFYLSTSNELLRIKKANVIVLYLSAWDDWFTYSTLYNVYYFNNNEVKISLGSVKIGQKNMRTRSPELPESFRTLSSSFFSLGQDDSYYESLNSLGAAFREEVLRALNDMALQNSIYLEALNENVTKVSLLRSVSKISVEGQFRRLAQGNASLTPYNFQYIAPKHLKSATGPMVLDFNVLPESNPPTNIHVVIGRNGVGKTHLFSNMILTLLNDNKSNSKYGHFIFKDQPEKLFANLVSVSFSAFDEADTIVEKSIEQRDKTKHLNCSYIGIKRVSKVTGKVLPKSPIILKNNFVKSVEKCIADSKSDKWLAALEMLEADPIFKEAEVSQLAKLTPEEDFTEIASKTFNNLSSGHKIVLLTTTQLVEKIEERSLVLLDEPEGYLHPPLLSAFIRALSDLLVKRNAVAIIGTHSPVVLQEVPQSCVWKLRRNGANAVAERLEIESFGENVGLLTQEVFGLEVADSGFHRILKSIVSESDTYEEAIGKLNNQLGFEARAILRNLLFKHK